MAKTIWAEARQDDTVQNFIDWLFNPILLHYLQRNGQKETVKKTTNVDFCTLLFGEILIDVMKINQSAVPRRISLLYPTIQQTALPRSNSNSG
jgi:hypothetical protein